MSFKALRTNKGTEAKEKDQRERGRGRERDLPSEIRLVNWSQIFVLVFASHWLLSTSSKGRGIVYRSNLEWENPNQ